MSSQFYSEWRANDLKDLAENLRRHKVSDQVWTGYQMAADHWPSITPPGRQPVLDGPLWANQRPSGETIDCTEAPAARKSL